MEIGSSRSKRSNHSKRIERLKRVERLYDATFIPAVDKLRPKAIGAETSELSTMPMIE
jgi:hypothetical protein